MAILHMNVDTCRSTLASLRAKREQMEAALASMQASVHNMIGTDWIAPGATEYMREYQQWQDGMRRGLQVIDEMCRQLENEIREWEQAAASF